MSELSDLFDKDPLSHTDADLEVIIKGFRDMRSKFNLGDTRAGTVKAKKPKALEGMDDGDLAALLNTPSKL